MSKYFKTRDADTLLEIGDETESKPKLKLKKWDEANFSIELLTGEPIGTGELDPVDKKIKFKTDKKEIQFYDIPANSDHPEGAFEFNIVLKKKNSSGIFEFLLTKENVSFYRQGPLTELIGQEGIVSATETEGFDAEGNIISQRPENVVGSYAVYHSAPPKNRLGGKSYKAGKICHIYRPKATDKDGISVWCDLSITENRLFVIVPQAFLDSAKYPVEIDPTIGYDVIGGTQSTKNAGAPIACHVGDVVCHTGISGEIIVQYSLYGRGTGSPTADLAAYAVSGTTPGARLAAAVTVTMPSSNAWTNSSAVSQSLVNRTKYGVANGNWSGTLYTYYDTLTGDLTSSADPGALPATWVHDSYTATIGSRYATYTVPNQADLILED